MEVFVICREIEKKNVMSPATECFTWGLYAVAFERNIKCALLP